VLRLGDWRVGAVMTLRTDIVWLDLDDTPEEIQRQIINSAHHSRLPVCQGSLDHVLGVVHTKDLLVQSLAEQRLALAMAIARAGLCPGKHTSVGRVGAV
jgi:putative hemolysin